MQRQPNIYWVRLYKTISSCSSDSVGAEGEEVCTRRLRRIRDRLRTRGSRTGPTLERESSPRLQGLRSGIHREPGDIEGKEGRDVPRRLHPRVRYRSRDTENLCPKHFRFPDQESRPSCLSHLRRLPGSDETRSPSNPRLTPHHHSPVTSQSF